MTMQFTISMCFCACVMLASNVAAQVRVMPRVDLQSDQVRPVVRYWVDSVESWRMGEHADGVMNRGADVVPGGLRGIVKNWFAQDDEVRMTFPPTILSVEPEDSAWVIRTMFSHINSVNGDIYPLGILRTVIACRPADTSIVDPLASSTRGWTRTVVGDIVYVHPPTRPIDARRASEANTFMTVLAHEFAQDLPDSVHYYVMPSRDALCAAVGVEYYAAPPAAISYPSARIVISGTNDEWNAHELVHIVLARYEGAVPVVREGVATLLGGSLGRPFEQLLATYLQEHPAESVPSLKQLFSQGTQEEQYIIGAALCKAVYDKKGKDGLVTLLAASTPLRVMDHMTRMLGLSVQHREGSLAPVLNAVNATLRETGRSGAR